MHKRLRIALLPIFLVLSLLFLWLAFPLISKQFFLAPTYTKVDLNLSNQLYIPTSFANGNEKIRVYNKKYQLYYSVDGGVYFEKASGNELAISAIKNPNLIYRPTSVRWRHPAGEFEKIKSVVLKIRDENEQTESQPVSYIFYDSLYRTLPVVHLTVKTSDLFDWEHGIMNLGENSTQDSSFYKQWWWRPANYTNRGIQSAKTVNVKFIESNTEVLNQFCEMRISGNATRSFPQKSLKFIPLESNGKRGEIKFPIWKTEGAKTTKSFLLRQSGNDNNKTLFADLLMHRLAKGSKVLIQEGYPVSVFINGNYWGIYNLRVRIDREFIANETGEKADKITILYCEGYGYASQLKDGKKIIKSAFDQLIDELPTDTPLSNKEYNKIKGEISIKSFIDYIIFETFYANQDWLYNNTTWYKAGEKKWKWILNDLDCSLAYTGYENVQANLFDELKTRKTIMGQLFSALISNEKFKQKFKKRVNKIITTRFSDKRIDEIANELKKQYEHDIDAQIRRWRFIDNLEQWEKDCAQNVTFLKERRKIYQKQVDSL